MSPLLALRILSEINKISCGLILLAVCFHFFLFSSYLVAGRCLSFMFASCCIASALWPSSALRRGLLSAVFGSKFWFGGEVGGGSCYCDAFSSDRVCPVS